MVLFGKERKNELEGFVDVNNLRNTKDITKTLCSVEVEDEDEDMAKDLAYLVGEAISVWAKKYQLENMPRKIILEQAISILSTTRDFMK